MPARPVLHPDDQGLVQRRGGLSSGAASAARCLLRGQGPLSRRLQVRASTP